MKARKHARPRTHRRLNKTWPKASLQIVKKEFKPGIIILALTGPLQIGVECKQLELAFDQLLRDGHTASSSISAN